MSENLSTVDFACKVNGKDAILKIKTDLTWGETQDLLTRSVTMSESGAKDFQFNNFCDILLTKTIVSGLPFPPTNLVKMKDLPMSEISIILGEIMRIIPLESYFNNLGMSQEIQVPKV
jgi:hypothetical protein|tara:strand:- start:1251 stop:1604 length:354 start_codon:yes stop_codon:yes gene_type:complete